MTPLRDAFSDFLEGAGAVFGAAIGMDSAAGTGGGDFTVTLAATALYRGSVHNESVMAARYNKALTPGRFSVLRLRAPCARVPLIPGAP
jgi:hypothetical protein